MKKSLKKIKGFSFLSIAFIFLGVTAFILFKDSNSGCEVIGKFLSIFLVPILSWVLSRLTIYWDLLSKPYIKRNDLSGNSRIRISFSYIIRIKISNKYVLVFSDKNKMFQPIGGVYHYNVEIQDYLKREFNFQRDSSHGDKNDLRAYVKYKKIDKFIKWFEKNEHRENTPNREFNEEIGKTGHLNKNVFSDNDLKLTKINTFYRGIEYGAHYDSFELLRFDLFELKLNDEQEKFVKDVWQKDKKHFYFANTDELKRLGVGNDYKQKFGTHSIYLREELDYDK